MAKKLTQTALARALGISQAMVSKLKAEGMPTSSVEAAQAWRRGNLDPALTKEMRRLDDEDDDDDADLRKDRARLMKAQAASAELALAERRGEMIRRVAVIEHWGKMTTALRARMLLIPPTAAQMIGPSERVPQVQEILKKLVYEALTELADGADSAPNGDRPR
jgi:phage terminase Nu1 subunit (DNA packaging protein)